MGEARRRVLLADTTVATRTALEPILRNEGWEILPVESSFQVLRTVRDLGADLILINPDLPGPGVTGADVARTLKGATQFRHLPVLFLLHGDRAAPSNVPSDGSLQVDQWDRGRIVQTLKQALGLVAPSEAAPREIRAEAPRPEAPERPIPTSSESLVEALTDLVAKLTVRLDAHLGSVLDERERHLREEGERRIRMAVEEFFAKEAPAVLRQEVRDHVKAAVEHAVREVARDVVPEVAERLIAEEIARLRRQYGVE